ncbi:MAG: RNA methyltransferase [Pseudomonadota bacterium]
MTDLTPKPEFILVEPQMGENIGAAARAMWNFGFERMRLVDPRDGWPNPRAGALASGAGRVLDAAAVFATTEEATADLHYVYATTARSREMTKTVFTPEAAAADIIRRHALGEKIGILYGRERTGLENEDVLRAHAIITVPVNPEFPSLNLAQCVLLLAYELRRQIDDTPPEVYQTGKSTLADVGQVDRMLSHLIEELEEAEFFFPPEKKGSMQLNLRNLFRRAPLTDQDVRTLHGLIRALTGKRQNPRKE